MADIFLSYASSERELARAVAQELTALGYSVWWDFEIVGGANFRKEINRELSAARTVIVLWTPVSVQSNWVLEEADEALHLGKLIPLRVAELDVRQLPLGFRNVQTLVRGDRDGLSRALGRAVGSAPVMAPAARDPLSPLKAAKGYHTGQFPVRPDHARIWQGPEDGTRKFFFESYPRPAWTLIHETLAIVADGRAYGGLGNSLSSSVTKRFESAFFDQDILIGMSRPAFLWSGLLGANESMTADLGKLAHNYSGRCCPILAAYIYDRRRLWWIGAGDCMLLHYRTGQLRRLNVDHSMGAFLDQQAAQGLISAEAARTAANRQAQRSGLTGGEIPMIDGWEDTEFPLAAGDWLVLATQGLKTLTGNEIALCIGQNVKAAPETLVTALLHAVDAKRRPDQDNAAIIAIHID